MKKRILFVTSHPIQYQVPVFRQLAAIPDLEFSVLFAMLPEASEQGKGFGVDFSWDIPLLEGYAYQLLDNIAAKPSVTEFRGCDTPAIGSILKATRPDAVIVNGWVVKTCLQTLWACKRLGIPCLVRGEANNLRERPAWKRLLQRLLVGQYAACLYIGEQNRAFYRSHGVRGSKLFAAPYCVENDRFEALAQSLQNRKNQLREQWRIPPQSTCYVFCGKFEPKKQPLVLLEAFKSACKTGTGLHLLMVGDGELRTQCEAFACDLQLPVAFTGFLNQSEIVQAYVAADCLVLPSDAGETWGLVVNEAMACGMPAIVSDRVGCAVDLVIPGVTGDVFTFGEWGNLANLLAARGANRAGLERMGESANRHIKAYSPEKAAQGIERAVSAVYTHHTERD